MNVAMRVICCFLVFLIIVWTAGCSNQSSYDIRNDHESSKLDYVSKFFRKRNIIYNRNMSLNSLKQNNFNSNRYVYNDLNKGSYSSFYYRVKPGDTLFYIAWITGNNCSVLAHMNKIGVNDVLKVGQILEVNGKNELLNKKNLKRNSKMTLKKKVKVVSDIRSKLSDVFFEENYDAVDIDKDTVILDKKFLNVLSLSNHNVQKIDDIPKDNMNVLSHKERIGSGLSFNDNIKKKSSISWCWPADGKVIRTFSSSEGGNKGIDISGVLGQPIFSASLGKVVYAGDALFGYGNLIIIKHDNDFLSIYAHNSRILVVEQQNVVLGQKIATMGSSGSDTIKLHFEIRYQGRLVDPLYYLPKK